ncbi:DEAD/DEAH box helicase [Helicobacter suis]|uniref:DEAD/DEAH box helicase n=1 Tax=Helicobacter suis TaxID=104628 RepID=UPI0024916D8E|nr:AAA domain-containing protein [Helicobacter suis]
MQEQIDILEEWLKDMGYIQEHLESTATKLNTLDTEISEKKAIRDKELQAYEVALEDYRKELELIKAWQSLQDFLHARCSDIMDMESLPFSVENFVRHLLDLHEGCALKRPFDSFDFDRSSHGNKIHVLKSLYQNYQQLLKFQVQIQKDVLFLLQLQAENLQDTQAKVQIDQIEQELKQVEQAMEAGEDLNQRWRELRNQRTELKNKHTALNHACYEIFTDHENVCAPIENILQARNLADLLQRRLKHLSESNSKIQDCIKAVIQEIQTRPIPEKPLYNNSLQQEIQVLQEQQQVQLKFKEQREKQTTECLQKLQELLNLENSELSLDEGIKQAQQANQEIKAKLTEHKEEFGKHQRLFEKWVRVLDESFVAGDYKEIEDIFKPCCNVVAITSNSGSQQLDQHWGYFDMVIIDEVSKCTPLELLMPLMRARKAILIGDHRQLPPTFGEDIYTYEEELIKELQEMGEESMLNQDQSFRFRKMVSATLFKELFEQAPEMIKEQLTEQYRMHPRIMRMVNRFYKEPLICANPDKDRSHGLQLGKFLTPETHCLWIDTTTEIQTKDNYNQQEASLIAKTLKAMDLQLGQREEKVQVGVVSFYQAQVRRIKEKIRKEMGSFENFKALNVDVNTVIRYQGKEKPIILVSMVATRTKKSQHANTARYEFVNVAWSRAQNLLMVFGNMKVFKEQEVYLSNKEKVKVYRETIQDLEFGFPESSTCSMEEYQKSLEVILKDSK